MISIIKRPNLYKYTHKQTAYNMKYIKTKNSILCKNGQCKTMINVVIELNRNICILITIFSFKYFCIIIKSIFLIYHYSNI